MFATRLRILMAVLALVLLGLFGRALQVQWWQHNDWVGQAQKRMEQTRSVETSRGRLLDVKGRVLAEDAPCVDAAVDYRVITRPADERWVKDFARARLRARMGQEYLKAPRERQKQYIEEEMGKVRADIETMWVLLGDPRVTGLSADDIEDRRQRIVRKVQMQRRLVWYQSFLRDEKERHGKPPTWWQKWLTEDSPSSVALLDSYDITVAEQFEPHVVLPAVGNELANYLGKYAERFPGLVLRPGLTRKYPYGESACHVIGYLSPVTAEDLAHDAERGDPARKYFPADLIGRAGMERVGESVLRGNRGQMTREVGHEATLTTAPEAGKDLTLSIDIELQKKIEAAFVRRKTVNGKDEGRLRHGAAIVIDVPTGQVRALVSYPTYDLNTIGDKYLSLMNDTINRPLMNRATMAQLEPGSTVKPMVGMAGITEKVVGIHEGIECTGKLQLDGKVYSYGKCWTYKLGQLHHLDISHHQTPGTDPHRGSFGNPDGFLIYADALQRSCNVWPETVADRLGLERLVRWYNRFGLGRRTGIEVPESPGRLPDPEDILARNRRAATWFAAIGQGIVATPIQMANEAATIAREGLWMRPTLVAGGLERTAANPEDERRQLPLDPAAVAEAKRGMTNVVNTLAGTGKLGRTDGLIVAGKTGSAQASKLTVEVLDDRGNPVIVDGKPQRKVLQPAAESEENPEIEWYRAGPNGELAHAWYIGFAPADRPRVAFAVLVEYGLAGGSAAGPIANAVLDAATEEGYLGRSGSQP